MGLRDLFLKIFDRANRIRANAKAQSESYLADDSNAPSFKHQLAAHGLEMRDITGDGNCLFRALGDQLQGHGREHLRHRQDVCDFMQRNKDCFEPFMEDGITFEKHLQELRKSGTYGGNDSIVAFARLHNVDVLIHQLNAPPWTVSGEGGISRPQVHLTYHNGEHYSSVRKMNDKSETAANIKLNLDKPADKAAAAHHYQHPDEASYDVADDEIVARIMQVSGCLDVDLVKDTLVDCEFEEDTALAQILALCDDDDAPAEASGGMWAPGGTGDRIFGGGGGAAGGRNRGDSSAKGKRLTKQLKKERAAERRRAATAAGVSAGAGAGDEENEEFVIEGVDALRI